ncbi:MAG: sugar phosphate isomerase/epimerase family protein [Eubacteriales bacterium]
MKTAISTLGCPRWPMEKIVRVCAELGIQGIELRGLEQELEPARMPCFSEENFPALQRLLEQQRLRLVGYGSSVRLHDAGRLAEELERGRRDLAFCARVGMPFLRVFGDRVDGEGGYDATLSRIVSGLRRLCDFAADTPVHVLLETHGQVNSLPPLTYILREMSGVKNFGVIWDFQHTDRACGDEIDDLYDLLLPFVRHVHVKDHVRASTPPFRAVPVGQGDIPLRPYITRLLSDGYTGYFSFEWEKFWAPELPEPEEVFPLYAAYMKELAQTIGV